MTKGQTNTLEERLAGLEERFVEIEEKVAAMQTLFARWLENQVAQAKRSLHRPQQVPAGPVDEQLMMINARAPERQAKGRDATVKLGDADFDGAIDRINNKRREAQGK